MQHSMMVLSRTTFDRLRAHAPENLQCEADAEARRAISALCYTEDHIRQQFIEEEFWHELTEEAQHEAISRLLDAWEYEQAHPAIEQAILDAIARYVQDLSIQQASEEDSMLS